MTTADRRARRYEDLEFYNLDVIIAVGYRVKSHRGTQFRQWATQRLREYIVKGFHDGRRAVEKSARQGAEGLFRRTAGAHPGHPLLGTAFLPEGAGYLRDER